MFRTHRLHHVAISILFLFAFVLISQKHASAFFSDSGTAETWVPIDSTKLGGASGRNQNSLVFNPSSNEPYVVTVDFTNHDNIVVKKFNGTSWVTVGTTSLGRASNFSISLVFHPVTNEPYVSFADQNEGKVSVFRFNSSTWVPVGNTAFSIGSQALATTLAFNPVTNEPYVMYLDRGVPSDGEVPLPCSPTAEDGSEPSAEGGVGPSADGCDSASESGFNQIVVMKFDGMSWVQVGDAFDSSSSNPLSLAFDPITAEPYVAHIDGISHQIRMRKFDGSSWVAISSPGVGTWADMMFSPLTSEPYVAYLDEVCGYGITVKKLVSSSWVPVGNHCIGGATELDLEFSPTNGRLYVAYIGANYSPKVVTFDGASWLQLDSIAPNVEGPYGINMAISPSTGQPYVMYGATTESGGENNATSTTSSCDWNPAFGTSWDASKKNLVLITHGNDGKGSDSWLQTMGKEICDRVDNSQTAVRVYDWEYGAANGLQPWKSYENAVEYGKHLADMIISKPIPENIHLIAHSAGSNLVQTTVDNLGEYYASHPNLPKPYIHLTFLDAYVPDNDDVTHIKPEERYGDLHGLPGYAEQYVTLADLAWTYSQLKNVTNFDITYLNPVKSDWPKDQNNLIQEHMWPTAFYNESITPSTFRTIQGNGTDTFYMGFPFSTTSVQINRTVPNSSQKGKWCIVTNVSEPYRRCLDTREEEKRDVILTNPDALANISGNGTLVDVSQFIAGGSGVLPPITMINPGVATIEIPAHTSVVSSDPDWNGIFMAPKETLIKDWPWADYKAVELGFDGGHLTFNKPVKITFFGQKGKEASYFSGFLSLRKAIENCPGTGYFFSGDDLPPGGDCKISVGDDLIIWTKHFTTFVAYAGDNTPPTTSISTAGTGGSEWFRSGVEVTLTATDTPDGSGVASTTYSLDNGVTWQEYTTPFTLTDEGKHTIQYQSTDNAGNIEDTKTTELYIDLTAPEAKVFANILTEDLLVIGADNMGSTTVEKTTTGYTITDEAGHTTKLTFKKAWNGEVLTLAQLTGMQYDDAPAIILPKSSFLYVWTPWKGVETLTNQTVHVNKTYTIGATYLKPLDKTVVLVHENGTEKQKQTFPGLKFVTLTTNKGVVGYEL